MQSDMQPNSEQELVSRARAGDPDAFGELVRRHRTKAVGVATSLTRDTHLAEDIVQEALVKAFLKLGSIVDEKRFAAWLSRIVINEAYMKLRRGGPHGKERPFTAWTGFTKRGSTPFDTAVVSTVQQEAEQWDIDEVLFRLGQRALMSAQQVTDPTRALLRKELVESIRNLLHCLTGREREVFERFFLDGLPPQNIALCSILQWPAFITASLVLGRRYSTKDFASM